MTAARGDNLGSPRGEVRRNGRLRARSLVAVSLCLTFAVVAVSEKEARGAVPTVSPVIVATYPHDDQAFTQGLLFVGERLYESTGLYGSSTVRLVDLTTGVVKQSVSLPASEFGEGLASVDERLVQLTWKSGLARVYDLDSLQLQQTFDYTGEGWGLCFDGQRLVMSDGSSSLFFRDPSTFAMTGSVAVTRDGNSVRRLNELECVNGWVYANVWQTREIVKINPGTGEVGATVTVDGLLTAGEAANADVLNGIAYLAQNGRFYVTGKLWPKMFEMEFPDAAAPHPPPSGAAEAPASGEPSANSGLPKKPVPSNVPPKVNSGCHCATSGGVATLGEFGHWGLGGLALMFLRTTRRRAAPQTNA